MRINEEWFFVVKLSKRATPISVPGRIHSSKDQSLEWKNANHCFQIVHSELFIEEFIERILIRVRVIQLWYWFSSVGSIDLISLVHVLCAWVEEFYLGFVRGQDCTWLCVDESFWFNPFGPWAVVFTGRKIFKAVGCICFSYRNSG